RSAQGRAYCADVTGDGKADVVVVDGHRVEVRVSTGATFDATLGWITDGVTGALKLLDVDGDGRSDLVTQRTSGVDVRLSDGTRFGDPVTWLDLVAGGVR